MRDVAEYIDSLELRHVRENFLQNGVDGPLLLSLTEPELIKELGLTSLQARKVLARMR